MSRNYWIIGPGRLGLSLGAMLAESGAAAELLFVGRSSSPPPQSVLERPFASYSTQLAGPPPAGTCLLLTVPDGLIAEIAASIAELGAPGVGCVVLHFSGAQPATILSPAAERGYLIGSLHPLQTIADAERGADRLVGACFTFEGDARAKEVGRLIVDAAHGRMLEVHPEDKARYHAACVFASNYVVACAAVAIRLLAEATGIGRDEAVEALEPLWTGAVANLSRPGLPGALTGPIARGDVETVSRHLASLTPETRSLYGHLALEALDVSREQGLGAEAAAAIEAEIELALGKTIE